MSRFDAIRTERAKPELAADPMAVTAAPGRALARGRQEGGRGLLQSPVEPGPQHPGAGAEHHPAGPAGRGDRRPDAQVRQASFGER
ncbi:MAG: hypothetical protein WDN45_13160 [Caulobacteraceae bacterium]